MWMTVGKFAMAFVLAGKVATLATWLGMPAFKVSGYDIDLARLAVFLVMFNLALYCLHLAWPQPRPERQ